MSPDLEIPDAAFWRILAQADPEHITLVITDAVSPGSGFSSKASPRPVDPSKPTAGSSTFTVVITPMLPIFRWSWPTRWDTTSSFSTPLNSPMLRLLLNAALLIQKNALSNLAATFPALNQRCPHELLGP